MSFYGVEALKRIGIFTKPRDAQASIKPLENPGFYTQAEISAMLIAPPPPEFDRVGTADTPVGHWSKEEGIPVFDTKPTEEIEAITIPNPGIQAQAVTRLTTLREFISKISMMEPVSRVEEIVVEVVEDVEEIPVVDQNPQT